MSYSLDYILVFILFLFKFSTQYQNQWSVRLETHPVVVWKEGFGYHNPQEMDNLFSNRADQWLAVSLSSAPKLFQNFQQRTKHVMDTTSNPFVLKSRSQEIQLLRTRIANGENSEANQIYLQGCHENEMLHSTRTGFACPSLLVKLQLSFKGFSPLSGSS